MFRRHSIVRFLAIALLAFGTTTLLPDAARQGFAAVYRASLNVTLRVLAPGPEVVLEPLPSDERFDTIVRFAEPWEGAAWTKRWSSAGSAYPAACAFLALWLASPMSWRGRFRALARGSLVLHVYNVLLFGAHWFFFLTLHVQHCADAGQHGELVRAPWIARAASTALAALNLEPTVYLVPAILIWMGTCFSRGEGLELVLGHPPAPPLAS